MATTSNFKTYERGSRYQTTQTMFTAGMHYTDTVVPEGAAKVLVNYDVGIDGISLKPRRGLQTVKASCPNDVADVSLYKAELVASKLCYQKDKEFIQVIASLRDLESVAYNIVVYTIDNTLYKTDSLVPYTFYKENHTYDKEGTALKPTGVFNKPGQDYKIHGVPCSGKKEHVGCFINDQYFFFNQATSTLMYTSFNTETEMYEMHELPAQQTTEAQAQQMGFNMLLENPYTYDDTLITGSAEDTISFNSINAFEDKACTIPAQQELIENQEYYYRISYAGAGTLRLVFEWTSAAQINWQKLSEETFTIDETLPKIVVPFSSPVDKAIIRCTAYRNEDPVDVIWFSFDYLKQHTKIVKTNVNYNLATCTTMTYWQNRLVLAGVKEDKSYLFLSAPELFEYFPFPNNADYLEEPIVAVQPLLENLLVFTKSKLYLYALDPTNGLVRTCIQNNLNISEDEAHLIQTVKNMAYFKSGNYYYMVVPKLNSMTGELTVAPISKNIKELFDTFKESVADILLEAYDIKTQYPLECVHNYLDYEAIHNVYMLKVQEGLYINFDLLYNTVKRTWSVYIYESVGALHIYKQDVTKPGAAMTLSYMQYNSTHITGINSVVYKPVFQLIEWHKTCIDLNMPYILLSDTMAYQNVTYNNKQFIDTGAIDINTNYKKRFREIQFRVANTSQEDLEFFTTFFIDGNTRSPQYTYEPVVDAEQGTLTLTKVYNSAVPSVAQINGHTKLGSWRLSKNSFPGANTTKIRIPVSGKGYSSQIKINCDSQKDYSLLDITNVYRQLYSR